MPLLLGYGDAAEHLGTDREHIRELVLRGEIEVVTYRTRQLIPADELARWVRENKRQCLSENALNGSWIVTFYRDDGSRFRKTLPAVLTRREVETLEARYRLEERAKPALERRGASVRDLFARYWSEHGQHIASRVSERAYLDAWANRLGDDTEAVKVTASQVAAAVAHWRVTPETPGKKKKPIRLVASSINHRLSCLQRVWRRAANVWGWTLATVPWADLKLDEPALRDRSIPADPLQAYLDALPPRSRWLTLFALHTGLRRGALLRLTRNDLDFERGIIRAVSKGRAGGKPTPFPVTEAVLAVLTAMGRLPEVGCIFAVTKAELARDRVKARRAAGLPDLRLHDMRHTFAQRLEDAGRGDLITDALHHSDPKLRRRYAHVRIARLGEALNEAQAATHRVSTVCPEPASPGVTRRHRTGNKTS